MPAGKALIVVPLNAAATRAPLQLGERLNARITLGMVLVPIGV